MANWNNCRMYLGKAGQKSHSAHLGLNGGFNFITSCEVNFRVPRVTYSPFQQLPRGRKQRHSRAGVGRSYMALDELGYGRTSSRTTNKPGTGGRLPPASVS